VSICHVCIPPSLSDHKSLLPDGPMSIFKSGVRPTSLFKTRMFSCSQPSTTTLEARTRPSGQIDGQFFDLALTTRDLILRHTVARAKISRHTRRPRTPSTTHARPWTTHTVSSSSSPTITHIHTRTSSAMPSLSCSTRCWTRTWTRTRIRTRI
jgi:hypothetical protein